MSDQTLQIAKELLGHLDSFLKQKENQTADSENPVYEFCRWMVNSSVINETGEDHAGTGMTDILIGMYLANLANLLKKEQNRFVSETPFSSFMDFQFLFLLNEHSEMTKSQLISANNMEMSSGIEVINRLKRSGWIQEKQNPEDRRSKLIYASEQGKAILAQYSDSGMEIYKSYSADLGETEKSEVLNALELLSKLNS